MTAGQLLRHESYMNAVRGLKEGQITEQAFLAMFTHKQRQGLLKMMESHRSPSTAAKWKSLQGTGSNSKKQSMPLAFIKGGLKKAWSTSSILCSRAGKAQKPLPGYLGSKKQMSMARMKQSKD